MEKSKGNKIVLFFIILLLIVLIIAGGAYAYIATDLLKSPDMLFKKYLFSEFVEISKLRGIYFIKSGRKSKREYESKDSLWLYWVFSLSKNKVYVILRWKKYIDMWIKNIKTFSDKFGIKKFLKYI